MQNKILIQNCQKAVKIPTGIRPLIRKSCNAVLKNEGFEECCEVSVTFVDNEEIAQLNGDFRNKPQPTDVLSFPLGEDDTYDVNQDTGAILLGDIIISLEKAVEQAELYGHSLEREVAFLTVHSMHHLLGYDHENGGEEAELMRRKEEEVLLSIGLPRKVTYGCDVEQVK